MKYYLVLLYKFNHSHQLWAGLTVTAEAINNDTWKNESVANIAVFHFHNAKYQRNVKLSTVTTTPLDDCEKI